MDHSKINTNIKYTVTIKPSEPLAKTFIVSKSREAVNNNKKCIVFCFKIEWVKTIHEFIKHNSDELKDKVVMCHGKLTPQQKRDAVSQWKRV